MTVLPPLALASLASLVDLDLDPESLASPVDLDLESLAREAPAPARKITTTAIGFTYPPPRHLALAERVERAVDLVHLERVERAEDLDLALRAAALGMDQEAGVDPPHGDLDLARAHHHLASLARAVDLVHLERVERAADLDPALRAALMDQATGDLLLHGDLDLARAPLLLASLARAADLDHLERVERAVDLDLQAVQAALVTIGDLPHPGDLDLVQAPHHHLESLERVADLDHLDLERVARAVDLDHHLQLHTMDHMVDGMALGVGDLEARLLAQAPHHHLASLERVAVKH